MRKKRDGSLVSAFSFNEDKRELKKNAINLVWNSLSPIARKKFVCDADKDALLNLRYFEYFNLDKKGEFFGYRKDEK